MADLLQARYVKHLRAQAKTAAVAPGDKRYRSPKHNLGEGSPSPFNIIGQPNPQQHQPGIIEIQRFDPRYPDLLQPDSRPISQEQLASEVKSIYAGLTMVETKCIHVDRTHASTAPNTEGDPNSTLANDHWQALIALHRTLLHEHHDFFLASQHPSASPALRRLASKYSMPARMWKHGIHSFLELLRRRLPESLDYMLAFIYLAYQMMALLYETVPTFEDTWIECLGDLGRYHMAIEDEDLRDRETWAGVARFWYSKAADKSPSVGRLYHHLAMLARPNALQQLYYYSRSLTCVQPFISARESILTLLDPILGRSRTSHSHSLPVDTGFIRAHGILFGKLSTDGFEEAIAVFLSQLDNHIGRVTAKWKDQGVYIAVTNITSLFDYGSLDSILRHVFQSHVKTPSAPLEDELSYSPPPISPKLKHSSNDKPSAQPLNLSSDFAFSLARDLAFSTLTLVLRRIGDKNVLPHVHVLFAFLSPTVAIPSVRVSNTAPWSEIVTFLGTLIKSEKLDPIITNDLFPNHDQNDSRPLPEDCIIRGQAWTQSYFPEDWFSNHDEEERSLGPASTTKLRAERILWPGHQIALGTKFKYREGYRLPNAIYQIFVSLPGLFRKEGEALSERAFKHVQRARSRLLRLPSLLSRRKLSGLISLLYLTELPLVKASDGTSKPVYSDSSIVDYVFSGLVLSYLLAIWFFGSRGRPFSLALMLATAIFWIPMVTDRADSFTTRNRWTILKVWAATTFGYIGLTYAEAIHSGIYLLLVLVISGLILTVGMAIQNFASGSLTNALPPSLAFGAFGASLLPQHFNPIPSLSAECGQSAGVNSPTFLGVEGHSASNQSTGPHTPIPLSSGRHIYTLNQGTRTTIQGNPAGDVTAPLPNPDSFALAVDDTENLASTFKPPRSRASW